MPPKNPKASKAPKGKKQKDIDWTADGIFDKSRSVIYIEHTHECPIFHIKAEEFYRFVVEQIPERNFVMVRNNNGKLHPRPGAFEIGFSQNAKTSVHNLWSGLDKGPPRRDKFPEFETLLPDIIRILKKFYPDLEKITNDEGGEDDDDFVPT